MNGRASEHWCNGMVTGQMPIMSELPHHEMGSCYILISNYKSNITCYISSGLILLPLAMLFTLMEL